MLLVFFVFETKCQRKSLEFVSFVRSGDMIVLGKEFQFLPPSLI